MPFGQTRTILDAAQAAHGRYRDLYLALAAKPDLQAHAGIFTFLADHQARLNGGLARYAESASHGVLDTWFKYPPERVEEPLPTPDEFGPDTTPDAVVKLILTLDRQLFWLYAEAARRAGSREVRELFEAILAEEQHEEVQAVRVALSAAVPG